MARKLAADGAGNVAIYEPPDDVFANPAAAYSRVHFHSGLLYPSVVAVIPIVYSIAAAPEPGQQTDYVAFHGQPGQPLIFGRLLGYCGFAVLPFLGSVPIAGSGGGIAAWIALGADATRIMIHQMWVNNKPAIAIAMEVFVTDVLV